MSTEPRPPEPRPQDPPPPDHLDDLVDEADEESFPASDPPAVTPRREPVQRTPKPEEPRRTGPHDA